VALAWRRSHWSTRLAARPRLFRWGKKWRISALCSAACATVNAPP